MELPEFVGDDEDVSLRLFLVKGEIDGDRLEHLLSSRAMSSSSNHRELPGIVLNEQV